jgi:hypothetical protein
MMRGRITQHLGSNFPERDGGAVVVEAKDSAWFFYTPGGSPGEKLEVYGIELGKGSGYTNFARTVGYLMGIDATPREILEDLSDEMALYKDDKEILKLARSLKGRAQIAMDMARRNIFEDYAEDEHISYVPYAHIERVWAAQNPKQRSFGREFRGLKGIGGAGFDEFFSSYIEAALWSENDEDGTPFDRDYGEEDFDEDTLKKLRADAHRFYENYHPLFAGEESQAGHDFWLNRNGHGAGFWDGDWPEPQATKLSEASEAYGTVNIYVGDDGKLHATV